MNKCLETVVLKGGKETSRWWDRRSNPTLNQTCILSPNQSIQLRTKTHRTIHSPLLQATRTVSFSLMSTVLSHLCAASEVRSRAPESAPCPPHTLTQYMCEGPPNATCCFNLVLGFSLIVVWLYTCRDICEWVWWCSECKYKYVIHRNLWLKERKPLHTAICIFVRYFSCISLHCWLPVFTVELWGCSQTSLICHASTCIFDLYCLL